MFGRGRKEDGGGDTSQSSSKASVFNAAASLSVGNPARGAPIVASGRAFLIAATKLPLRPAMPALHPLRIKSSPACSDKWKWGISRGSPAISSIKAPSISILSRLDRRSR